MTKTYTPWFLLVVALALAAVYLFPLYWMYVTSLKTGSEMFANPPTFWPNNPNPGIYPEVWARRAMPTFLTNSVLIAGGVTAITVILGTGCAYVLARYRNVWIDVGLFCVLMLQVLPASVMVTPLFVGFNQIGLLNYPRTAVVLAAAAKAMPFFVVLVRATFMSVPRELEEAALVDGNSRIGAFFSIVLPLAHLTAGAVEHPFANRHNQASAFGQRNETVRGHLAVFIVPPAQQGLCPGYFSRRHMKLGLISQAKFVVLKGFSKVLQQAKLLLHIGMHGRFEEAVGITPGVLGMMARSISLGEQVVTLIAVIGAQGNTHAG